MDALELLKGDHQTVKKLFEQAEGEDEKQQRQIFQQIKKELETHAHIEETIFYPAMQKHEELKDMVSEAIEEHKTVKTLLREMDSLADNQEFETKLDELMENVEHHAEEEEEGKMFPKIRQIVNATTLEELGKQLEAAKRK